MAFRFDNVNQNPEDMDTHGTPTSSSLGRTLQKLNEAAEGKIVGSENDDRASLFDFTQDKDQVIKLGGGDDVFVFSTGSEKPGVNGIVYGGEGDNDLAFLQGQLSDYLFTARSGEGIKATYINADGSHGAAVTFYGFETFTFNNADKVAGKNYADITISASDLYMQILQGDSNINDFLV